MNLLLSAPKGKSLEEFTFSLPFNLLDSQNAVDGHLCVKNEELQVYVSGELKETIAIKSFDEYAAVQIGGSSQMVARIGDTDKKCICSFTQENFLAYAELCKILNHYITTGILVTESDLEEPKCPKCHLPLDGYTECPYCASKVKVFSKLLKRIKPYKKLFTVAIICTVIGELVGVLTPYFNRILIDEYVNPIDARGLQQATNWAGFGIICLILVGASIVSTVFNYFNMKASYKVSLGLGQDLRQEVFDKSLELSMSSISKKTAGEIISRVSNDVNKLQTFITDYGKQVLVKVLSLIIVTVLLFAMNWKLALLAVIPVPFVSLLTRKMFATIHAHYDKSWRYSTEHSQLLHDTLNGISVVKSCGTEDLEIQKYEKASKNWAKSASKAEVVWATIWPCVDFLLTFGNYFILYFGSKMILGLMPSFGSLTLGQLVQFTSYVTMLYIPMRWIMQLPKTLADVSVSASKVFEILEEQTDVKDTENAVDLDINGDIEFKNVFFGYKVYNPVLKDISCKIEKGTMVGIVGHSGVGKSTMINLILRLYDVTQGELKIDGVNIKDISQQSLRSQVGVVLQETYLFEGTVLDNISYAKPNASFEEIIEASKIAHAHEFITKLPDGYNTRVGNKGHTLSGGERQRIAIARAILHNPKIIILDEATASLDTETEKQIQLGLNELCKGRTTIAIAHRLSTLSNADKLIVLDKGRLAETGTHEELMRKKGVYFNLVMAQRKTAKMKSAEE